MLTRAFTYFIFSSNFVAETKLPLEAISVVCIVSNACNFIRHSTTTNIFTLRIFISFAVSIYHYSFSRLQLFEGSYLLFSGICILMNLIATVLLTVKV